MYVLHDGLMWCGVCYCLTMHYSTRHCSYLWLNSFISFIYCTWNRRIKTLKN